MSFHEVQFPNDIEFGSSGGPEFLTTIITTQGGFEQRNINWSAARARYNVLHAVKSQSQIDELLAFFRARQGKAYGFRFKDWADFSATAQSIGTGNGSNKNFQLSKTYGSGTTYVREIKKPVSGSVKIYVNGVLQSSGVAVNSTTGLVTFTTAPANTTAITADFDFDVPVRFDADYLPVSFDKLGQNSVRDIPLVEVRV
jgi:uncharacterized protein (TIGR02217 family)